jgi:hypothetical protein
VVVYLIMVLRSTSEFWADPFLLLKSSCFCVGSGLPFPSERSAVGDPDCLLE